MRLGFANHWILLVLYGAALILAVLRLGQLLAALLLAAISLTPLLEVPVWLAVIGLGLYAAGTVFVVVSIRYFGRSAEDEPTIEGPYRFSRNPQWIGLFSALLGLSISSGSWLLVPAILAVGAVSRNQVTLGRQTHNHQVMPPHRKSSRSVRWEG